MLQQPGAALVEHRQQRRCRRFVTEALLPCQCHAQHGHAQQLVRSRHRVDLISAQLAQLPTIIAANKPMSSAAHAKAEGMQPACEIRTRLKKSASMPSMSADSIRIPAMPIRRVVDNR